MLAPGLTASLRAGPQFALVRSAFAVSANTVPRASRIITQARLQPCRPLTTSSNILSRLRPLPRRAKAPSPTSITSHPDPPSPATVEEDAGFSHLNLPPAPSNTQPPSVSRALLFFLGFSAASFAGATYYSLKDTQHIASQLQSSRDVFANISSYFTVAAASGSAEQEDIWGPGVTEQRLKAAKAHETATRLGMRLRWLMGWCDQLYLPDGLKEFVGRSYLIVAEKYLDLSPSKQMVVPVVAVNSVVFALWTLASVRSGGGGGLWSWMSRNFLHRPSANRTRTLLTSVYSHQSFLHFLFNNMALWSIGGSALVVAAAHSHAQSVPEASSTPHFLAFFTAAGIFAATVSHVVAAVRFRRVSALHGLEIARATVGRQASLGSSGAIYSTLVMSAFAFPDAQLGILFVPFISFPIGAGVAGLVAADVAGIVLRWKMFDHWAHLAGAAFGALYWWRGADVWRWWKREVVSAGVLE